MSYNLKEEKKQKDKQLMLECERLRKENINLQVENEILLLIFKTYYKLVNSLSKENEKLKKDILLAKLHSKL